LGNLWVFSRKYGCGVRGWAIREKRSTTEKRRVEGELVGGKEMDSILRVKFANVLGCQISVIPAHSAATW